MVSRRKVPVKTIGLAGLCLCAAVACGKGGSGDQRAKRDSLTERQRDTAISKSAIPGASAVGKAMRVADSTSAQVQASDTVR